MSYSSSALAVLREVEGNKESRDCGGQPVAGSATGILYLDCTQVQLAETPSHPRGRAKFAEVLYVVGFEAVQMRGRSIGEADELDDAEIAAEVLRPPAVCCTF